jgi:uncharacterized membrane protein
VAELARLLWGTVVHRPYVYAFLVCFLVFALRQLGGRRTLTFAVATWLVAFGAEYSSTRNGFPFGPYRYFDDTRGRELWISNVPFWDSLSFVFLSYFALALAAAVLSPPRDRARGRFPGLLHPAAPLLGGAVMMLLDVVIDPVTLEGDRWFLGRVYEYPYRGFYFGVTAANFAGWFVVGAASQWLFQRCVALLPWCRGPVREVGASFAWGIYAVYAGVFGFNLAVTVWIGDWPLAAASAAVSGATLVALALRLRARGGERVVVCAATGAEAGACRRGLQGVDGVEVLRTGVGLERAARALRARLGRAPRPALVVSSGFAGALGPGIEQGAVVTARAIHRAEGTHASAVAVPAALLRQAPDAVAVEVVSGEAVGSRAPEGVAAPAAMDMESAALAQVAAAAGVPFAVLRLVTDTPARPLDEIGRRSADALRASGLARLGHAAAVAGSALRRPLRTAAFVRDARGWCDALAAAWRARGARVVAPPPAPPARSRAGTR